MPNDIADWSQQASSAPLPPDWQQNNSVSGAGTASVTQAAVAGQRVLLGEATATVQANAGRVFMVRVWDGASGGTLIGQALIGDPSASLSGVVNEVKLHNLKTTGGNQITIDYDFPAQAGERQAITASGYNV